MDFEDLSINSDWDPSYLSLIFDGDFNDMSDLWNVSGSPTDSEILNIMDNKYSPVVEDISIDDEYLCQAVEAIEYQ